MELSEAWGDATTCEEERDVRLAPVSARIVSTPPVAAVDPAADLSVHDLLLLLRKEQQRQHRTLVICALLIMALALMHMDSLHRQLRKQITEELRPRQT